MQTDRLKKYWLTGFLFLLLLLISVGGITRLTRSGLSIVEWKPITGVMPPLTDSDWQQEFEKYQQTPEYQIVNSHFKISEYKKIYMWEYFHRLLGRVLFLFVLIPGLWLWKKKHIDGKQVFALVGLVVGQGLLGWLMVKSGLSKIPHVSPYLLAVHFFCALCIVATVFFLLCKMWNSFEITTSLPQWAFFRLLGVFLGIQIFYGCLTSGLKAGHVFNTYPLMNGQFLPPQAFSITPFWKNFFENMATVQWTHRWLGIIVFTLTILNYYNMRKIGPLRFQKAFNLLLGTISLQVLLGISTLLFTVPLFLAAAHQLLSALILLTYLNIIFCSKKYDLA